MAFAKTTRGKAGGRLRIGMTPIPKGTLEPWTYQETAALQLGGISGEFLIRATQNADARAGARASAGSRTRPQRCGRTSSARASSSRTAEPSTPTTSSRPMTRLSDPTPDRRPLSALQRRALARRHQEDRRPHGRVHVSTRRTRTSRTSRARRPTRRSSCRRTTSSAPSRRRRRRRARSSSSRTTPGVSAKYERNTGWWGGTAPLDGVDVTYYAEDAAIISPLLGGQIDLLNQIQFATGRALFNNPNVTDLLRARARRTGRSRCASTEEPRLKDNARPPGDRAHARPAGDRQDAVQQPRRPRQRLAVRAGVPVDGQERAAAAQGPREGQAADGRGRPCRRASRSSLTTDKTGEIPQLAQIIQAVGEGDRDQHELKILTGTAYFAGTRRPPSAGTTPWLNDPDEHHRLGPPRGAERAPQLGARKASKAASGTPRTIKNKKFDTLVKSFFARDLARGSAQVREADRAAPAEGHAGHLPVLLQLLARAARKVTGYKADPARPGRT